MPVCDEMGGFLGLELPVFDNFPWRGGRRVNSGRRAFEYILQALGNVRKVYLPRYACHTLTTTLEQLSIPFEFYAIDERLEIAAEGAPQPGEGEYVLFTHYFGLQTDYLDRLRQVYRGRLIVDQSLALFAPPVKETPTFYSPRKFAGLPDGGIAFVEGSGAPSLERDQSHTTASFLLQCLDTGTALASRACEDNERRIDHTPLRAMSKLTERLMLAVDFEKTRARREENFSYLHEHLGYLNKLPGDMLRPCAAFCYPLWTNLPEWRNDLIDRKIYIPVLWSHLLAPSLAGTLEQKLARQLIPLPVDQRYGQKEMERIVRAARAFMKGQ